MTYHRPNSQSVLEFCVWGKRFLDIQEYYELSRRAANEVVGWFVSNGEMEVRYDVRTGEAFFVTTVEGVRRIQIPAKEESFR
jgi:hypothetical protein